MDQDDPERRIAELERRMAAQRHSATPEPFDNRPTLTAESVHNVAFSKPRIGRRGYNEDEVDAVLDRVEAALRDPAARGISAAELESLAFSKPSSGKRGYNQEEVDAFLDLARVELSRRAK